jgi:hypothetical protein
MTRGYATRIFFMGLLAMAVAIGGLICFGVGVIPVNSTSTASVPGISMPKSQTVTSIFLHIFPGFSSMIPEVK